MSRLKLKNPKFASAHTKLKQECFIEILFSMLLNCKYPSYQFVDMTAGPGIYKHKDKDGKFVECTGSPLLSMIVAHNFRPELDLHSLCIEHRKEFYDKLRANLERQFGDIEELYTVLHADNKNVGALIEQHAQHLHGMVYYDPDGWPQLGYVAEELKKFENFDVLCHLATVGTKRIEAKVKNGANFNKSYLCTVRQYINNLGKKYNYLSSVDFRSQWCFLLSTNDPKAVSNILSTDLLVEVNTEEGQRRLETILLTKEEKQQLDRDRFLAMKKVILENNLALPFPLL